MGLLMAIFGTAVSYIQLSRFLRQDLTQSVATQQKALADYVARDVDNYLVERLSFLQRLAHGALAGRFLPTDPHAAARSLTDGKSTGTSKATFT